MSKHEAATPNPDWREVLPRDGYTSPLPADTLATLDVIEAHEHLQATRLLSDAGALTEDETRSGLTAVSGKLANAIRLLAGGPGAAGALAALLVAVGLVVAGPTAGQAQAMEAPQPDPAMVAARTVSVILDRTYVRVQVPVTTYNVTPRGLKCATVWGPTSYGQGFLARACSLASSYTVPVTLDARYVPLGRSSLRYTDDVAPMDSPVGTVTLVARRPSKFGLGTWTPTQYGDGLTVTARLYAYTPALGAWTPQNASPVAIQELRAGRWVTVAKATTNRRGVFLVTFIIGGGPHTLRVHRDPGATVEPTNGTARTFTLYPTDVPDGEV
jgi:hypothetical protein